MYLNVELHRYCYSNHDDHWHDNTCYRHFQQLSYLCVRVCVCPTLCSKFITVMYELICNEIRWFSASGAHSNGFVSPQMEMLQCLILWLESNHSINIKGTLFIANDYTILIIEMCFQQPANAQCAHLCVCVFVYGAAQPDARIRPMITNWFFIWIYECWMLGRAIRFTAPP